MKKNYFLKCNKYLISKLCCPLTHQKLHLEKNKLVSLDGKFHYLISKSGVPLFAEHYLSDDAARQSNHYNKNAVNYIKNLNYPHTLEYMKYLDNEFLKHIKDINLSNVAEICCGHGELLTILGNKNIQGIGVDISTNMIEFALTKHKKSDNFFFIQGDATKLPIKNESIESVFMFGGIHHVPDREALFSEIFRILQPGGHFYFREPVSDFFLWRWIRKLIYFLSPALDASTERPLLWIETVPLLKEKGFHLVSWRTFGFIGFCFFMNSDVLIFNRFFRFIPGIKKITNAMAYFDDKIIKLPGLSSLGLQVIGIAKKPLHK